MSCNELVGKQNPLETEVQFAYYTSPGPVSGIDKLTRQVVGHFRQAFPDRLDDLVMAPFFPV